MSLSISAVVPTSQSWPEIRPCLDAFLAEARELGAEVIVLDPHGRGLPADAERRYPGVVHLTEPGASIFRMRQVGLSVARGDVVAITEDHCVPPPGWLGRHLGAHREHPEVAAVAGPVKNGCTRRLIDWAIFLQNHARWFPPVPSGERRDADRANISYKRRVLPRGPSPEGRDDPSFDQGLIERGERYWLDGGNVVEHRQSLGLRRTIALEFHVGRSVAGLQVTGGMPWRRRITHLAGSPLIAAINLRAVSRAVLGRRVFPRRALASLPLAPLISTALAAGFLAGYAAGPATSPNKLL